MEFRQCACAWVIGNARVCACATEWARALATCARLGVRGCLSAEVECDGAALVSFLYRCEGTARMRGGSQAHPLLSCAACSARTLAFDGT